MKKIILLTAMLLCFSASAHAADTILVGSDGSNYTDACWTYPAASLSGYSFRAMRFQALNSGTISYFQKRVGSTPTGCTSDSVMWAIYEAGTNSTVGALKAYGVANNYNWTTTGAGLHNFPVTTTVTDLTVTAGTWYWITYYSYGSDALYYSNAGCSGQIAEYRGQGEAACYQIAGHIWLDWSSNWASYAETNVDYIPGGTPPASASYDTPAQTYSMWGIWASGPSPVPPSTAWTHGGSATISGSGFGTKIPVAPHYFGNFDDKTVNSESAVEFEFGASLVVGTSAQGCDENMVTDGSVMFKNSSSPRWIAAPHSKSSVILGGSHTDRHPSGSCKNSHITVGDSVAHDRWYVMYYKRFSPETPRESGYTGLAYTAYSAYVITLAEDLDNSETDVTVAGTHYTKLASGDGIKIDNEIMGVSNRVGNVLTVTRASPVAHSNGATVLFLAGSNINRKEGEVEGSYGWFTGDGLQIYGSTFWDASPDIYDFWIGLGSGGTQCSPLTSASTITDTEDAVDEWKHFEIIIRDDAPGYVKTTVDNVVSQERTCGTPTDEFMTNGDIYAFTLGSYYYANRYAGGGEDLGYDFHWWYLDDLYVDHTLSRVMLCNNTPYASATICEPQPPITTWNDTTITVTVNQGALSNGTNYLFVFDSTNTANTTGLPVTLGSTPPSVQGCTISGGTFR